MVRAGAAVTAGRSNAWARLGREVSCPRLIACSIRSSMHRAGAQRWLQVPGHRRRRLAPAVPAVAAAGLAGRAGDRVDRLLLPRSGPYYAPARGPGRRPCRRAHLRHRAGASADRARPRRGRAPRVSIFLSVFDVHINRIAGGGPHRPLDLRAGQLSQRRPRQGERGERAPRARHRHGRRRRDRGRADRRPDCAAHRDVRERGRQRRRGRAVRPDPLRIAGRRLSAARAW